VSAIVPSAPVSFSLPANWLYGIATANTAAPATGRPLQAVTLTCIVTLRVESVTVLGEIDAWDTSRRAGMARSLAWIVPVPAGQPFAEPPGTAVVCFDVNVVEPAAFVAVTARRNVLPASACVTV
jgi:hypothetical protein